MLEGTVEVASHQEVAGWAADTDRPDHAIELLLSVDGQVVPARAAQIPRPDLAQLGRFGRGAHGFAYRFEPPLSHDVSHAITVRFAESGAPLPNGHRRLYAGRFGQLSAALALRPVLVTSIGRCGSTLLLHRLSRHPQIVVPGVPPYEVKMAAYYANAFRVLTELDGGVPADANLMGVADHLGALPFAAQARDQAAFFRLRVPQLLGRTMQVLIAEFYANAARGAGRPNGRAFAEKCDFSGDVRIILRAMFPDLREIVLVRDLRDIYCSSRAFWSIDQQAGLDRLHHLQAQALALHREAPPDVLFLRYEDLVGQPTATDCRLREFLALDDDFVRDPAAEQAMFPTHGTSAAPASSVGRWRNEALPGDLMALVADAGAFNRAFDYG